MSRFPLSAAPQTPRHALLGPTYLSGPNLLRSIALTGGVALHAINVHIVTTILPSVVRDIGGLEYYAWNITLFVVTSSSGLDT